MKNSYIIGLIGLVAAVAAIFGLRGCESPDDIFQPGERVLTEVDWGQYPPSQFDGQIFTYARKGAHGPTLVILVPFASGSAIKKVQEGPDGADGYKILLERTTGQTGDGVYELTIDGIPGNVSHVRVELTGGEGHDVVLADADDESYGHFSNTPVPVMRVEQPVAGTAGPDNVRGFLLLPDRCTVTWSAPTVHPGQAVLDVAITTTTKQLELFFMSTEFPAPEAKNTIALKVDGNNGRSWTYDHR